MSRYGHVSVELGRGRKLEEIIASMHLVAKGVKSAPGVLALAERHGVAMPICRDVFDVLQGRRTPAQTFTGLLRSAAGAESDAG